MDIQLVQETTPPKETNVWPYEIDARDFRLKITKIRDAVRCMKYFQSLQDAVGDRSRSWKPLHINIFQVSLPYW
jgi:hypothetical protein